MGNYKNLKFRDTEDLDEYVAEVEDDTLAEKIYAQVGKKRVSKFRIF